MRAEARHQLKEDRLSKATLEAAGKTADWAQQNQTKLIAAIIGVIVVAAVAFGGWYYINSQDEKASAELSAAVRTLETPLRPAGTPEQPGYASFDSSLTRATTARKQFQAIVDKYPSTRTGKMARYFLGITAVQTGDNSAAERYLQEAQGSSDAQIASLAKFALASVYRAENKDAQAVDTYKQLIDKPTVAVSKVTAQLELAGMYESQQKSDDAKKLYEQIQKENPSTEAAAVAQQRAAALKK